MNDFVIPILAWAAWLVIVTLALRYVELGLASEREQPPRKPTITAFEEGYRMGWERHVAEFRMNRPEYDRGYGDGWAALLDLLDPADTGTAGYVTVRRRP
jgi:hypothetical protein